MLEQATPFVDVTQHPSGMLLSPTAAGFGRNWFGAKPTTAPLQTLWPAVPSGLEHAPRVVAPDGQAAQIMVTTGLFRKGSVKHRRADLAAVDCIGLDADAADWLVATGQFPATTPAKRWMRGLPQVELNAVLEQHRNVVLGAILASGLPCPTRIACSGYGLHLWFWLDRLVWATDHQDFSILAGAASAMVGKVNGVAGFSLLDPAAVDTGTRLLRPLGTQNLKGHIARDVRVSGFSDVRLPFATIESLVGVTTQFCALSGKVTKTRPRSAQGNGSPTVTIDWQAVLMPDGRSIGAWAADLQPGCGASWPKPADRGGRMGGVELFATRDDAGALWVYDYPLKRSYKIDGAIAPAASTASTTSTAMGQALDAGFGAENENDVLEHEVPPSLYTLKSQDCEGLAAAGAAFAVLDPLADAVLESLAAGAKKIEPWESSPQGLAEGYAAQAGEAKRKAEGLPEILIQAGDFVAAMVDEAFGYAPTADHDVAIGAMRWYEQFQSFKICNRAPWIHSSSLTGAIASSTRAACNAFGCPDCGPRSIAATQAAAQATVAHMVRDGKWQAVFIEDVGETKTLERWCKASPKDRAHFSVALTPQTTASVILWRRGHRPQATGTKPSRLIALMGDASEHSLASWIIAEVGRIFDRIVVKAWGKARATILRGRSEATEAISTLRDGLLGRPRATKAPAAKDPNSVRIVSYDKPSDVIRAAEALALDTAVVESSACARSHRAKQVWSLGGRVPTGAVLAQLIEDGEIKPARKPKSVNKSSSVVAGDFGFGDDIEIDH